MNEQIALYFRHHPKIDTFYFTSDGYAFFRMADAQTHVQHLHDKEILQYQRHEIDLTAEEDDTDDDPQGATLEAVTDEEEDDELLLAA